MNPWRESRGHRLFVTSQCVRERWRALREAHSVEYSLMSLRCLFIYFCFGHLTLKNDKACALVSSSVK